MCGNRVINVILQREGIKAGTFAKKIGVTPTQIYDLQNGKTQNISTKVAHKIMKVYPHYMYPWLLSGEGDITKDEALREYKPEFAKESPKASISPSEGEKPLESPENAASGENIQRMAISFEELMDKYEDMTQQRDYWRNKAAELEYRLSKLEAV